MYMSTAISYADTYYHCFNKVTEYYPCLIIYQNGIHSNNANLFPIALKIQA